MTPIELTDDDVAALLHAAAPDVSTDGVVAAVIERSAARHRARGRRRTASAMGIAATITLVAVGLVAWATGANDTVDVAVPSSEPTVATTAVPDGTEPAVGEEIGREAVPGDGDSVTPIAIDDRGFWLVRGSSSGDFGSGQRTISRWSPDGVRGPITFVEGIPTLAIAALDRLWVVVAEPAAQGAPEWRLKEIRPKDGLMLSSTAIPLTAKPLRMSMGIADPTGEFIGIDSAAESVQVQADDHSVGSTPPSGQVAQRPPVVIPPHFSIDGTDLVQRKGTS